MAHWSHPAARRWLDTVADVRLHGRTRRLPTDVCLAEKPKVRPLSVPPYDVSILRPVRASCLFRATVGTHTYSVPAEHAGAALILKVYPDHLRLYHQDRLIPAHASP